MASKTLWAFFGSPWYIDNEETLFEYCFTFFGFFSYTFDTLSGETTIGWIG